MVSITMAKDESRGAILVQVKPSGMQQDDLDILSDAEKQRLDGMFEGSQPPFVTARALLRRALARILGLMPEDVPLQQEGAGRVELLYKDNPDDGPYFSISHTGAAERSIVAVAVSEDMPVGVDIEQPDRDMDWRRLAESRMHDVDKLVLKTLDNRAARQRFFELWTLKEAMVKLEDGKLIRYLREIALDLSEEEPRLLTPTPGGRSDLFLYSRHLGDLDLMLGLVGTKPATVDFVNLVRQ